MHSVMSTAKSQMFLLPEQKIFSQVQKTVDKLLPLCLNVSNICKDFDGKFVLSEILPESRWLVKTGENGKCDLIPESDV